MRQKTSLNLSLVTRHSFLYHSSLLRRRVTRADFLCGDFSLKEKTEVVAPARLRVSARHVEAAERMYADERARAFSVEVEMADVNLATRAFEFLAVVRVDRARQSILRVVRNS